MDLIDRYLGAVKSCLTTGNHKDVIRELAEDIRSQVEDRETELGRPLTQDEVGQILKQWGHPMVLASRYSPQRQLIGPCVFPIYWMVIRIALSIALLVHVVVGAVSIASGRDAGDVIRALATLPFGPLMIVFGWVTLIFAVIDRVLPRFPLVSGWDPNRLPTVPTDPRMPSRASLLVEFTGIAVFALWMAALARYQWMLFGPAAALIELGPGALRLHMPLLVLYLVNVVIHGLWVARPAWARQRSKFRIVAHATGLLVIGLLLNAGDLIVVKHGVAGGAAQLASLLNTIARIGLTVGWIAVMIAAAVDLVRLMTAGRLPDSWLPRRTRGC